MEYLTFKFENTRGGLAKKDAKSRELSAQGWSVTSEQIEQGHIKGDEQCCFALICLPLIFAAGRTPAIITVTYGRDLFAQASRALSQGFAACLQCGARFQNDASYCDQCGKPVVRPAQSPPPLAPASTKACPFCAEQIQQNAKKCRYCGEFLIKDAEPSNETGEL